MCNFFVIIIKSTWSKTQKEAVKTKSKLENILEQKIWAAGDAFVGAESTNSFAGWFDDNGASTGIARGAWLEATVNVRALLGLSGGDDLPPWIWYAGAAYQTGDNGSLLTALQAPQSVNFDFNIDADEYARITLCEITPGGCPIDNACAADFDGDGDVDLGDFGVFGGLFGRTDCLD